LEYHWNLEVKKKWFGPTGGPDSETGWKLYLSGHERWLSRGVKAIRDQTTPLTKLVRPKISQESVVPIINSIVNDEKAYIKSMSQIRERSTVFRTMWLWRFQLR